MCRHLGFSDIARHEFLPLLVAQGKTADLELLGVDQAMVQAGVGAAAGNPAPFALASQSQDYGDTAEEILDAWLSVAFADRKSAEVMAEHAYQGMAGGLCSELQLSGLFSGLRPSIATLRHGQTFACSKTSCKPSPEARVSAFAP